MTKHRLYSINSYAGKTKKFIDNEFTEYKLDSLVDELENDNGYHMRVNVNSEYIFFGDCDKFDGTFTQFAKLLIDFLEKFYKINIEMIDISYTENEGVNGSFHYSIPKLYGSCLKIKEIHERFYENYKDIFYKKEGDRSTKVVDTSIYSNKWFRYPQQKKENKNNTRHIIKHGNMIDFVVEFIPIESICINDMIYIFPTCEPMKVMKNNKKRLIKIPKINNNNSIDDCDENHDKNYDESDNDYIDDVDDVDDIDQFNTCETVNCKKKVIGTKNMFIKIASNNGTCDTVSNRIITSPFKKDLLIKILSGIDADDCNDWTHVGMALKNESSYENEFFDLWNEWSTKSGKYDGKVAHRKKWNSFKKMRGYSLDFLISLLKKTDIDKYDDVQQYMSVQKILNENKKHFPENDCILDEINKKNNKYEIILADDHCPIYDNKHSQPDDSHRYFEISSAGCTCIKCTHAKCQDKSHPKDGLVISKQHYNVLFSQNNYVQNNNNYNVSTTKSIFNVIDILKNKPKIFDNDEINKFVIKGLVDDDVYAVSKAIVIIVREYVCFVKDELMWYACDENLWKKCENISNHIFPVLTDLYAKVKNYVIEQENLNNVIKNDYIEQINNFVSRVKKGSNLKELLSQLREQLEKKDTFDKNTKLFGFTNGVYDFNEMAFRQIKPSDMISMTCGYAYSNEYKNKENIINTLGELFSTATEIDTFFEHLCKASCHDVDDPKLLMILQSVKINHRKTLLSLLKSVFGDYMNTMKKISTIMNYDETVTFCCYNLL
jgi:phage/plasmid-associated DNA primase